MVQREIKFDMGKERCKLEDMPRQARLDDRQGPVVKGRKILCQMGWRCESWDTQGRPIISLCPNVPLRAI